MKKDPKLLCLLFALLIALSCLPAFAAEPAAVEESGESAQISDAGERPALEYETADELNGKIIGVMTGSMQEAYAQRAMPDSPLQYYSSYAELLLALQTDKIDAFFVDGNAAKIMLADNDDVFTQEEPMFSNYLCYAVNKGKPELWEQLNEYLDRIREDGTLEEIHNFWHETREDDSDYPSFDYSELPDVNGTIRLGFSFSDVPMNFMCNGMPSGMEQNLLYSFAEEYGYAVDAEPSEFTSLLTGCSTGVYDIAAGSMIYTEERAQSALLTGSFEDTTQWLMVRITEKTAPTEQASPTAQRTLEYETAAELNGKAIGVVTGSVQENYAKEAFPDSPIQYFTNVSELLLALQAKKIEAFIVGSSTAQNMLSEEDDVAALEEPLFTNHLCFAVSKDKPELCEQLNEYIGSIREDGSLQETQDFWHEAREDSSDYPSFDYSVLPDTNGTIRLGYFNTTAPLNFICNGLPSGMEHDILYSFAEEYGYAVETEQSQFSSLLTGCSTGVYDLAAATLIYTEERAESALLTDSYKDTEQWLIVRVAEEKGAETADGFFGAAAASFEKNFLRENRWQLVLSGLGITLLITFVSAILGTVLGFLLCLIRRGSKKAPSKAVAVIIRIIQGIPVVVLLMVLYYIVFSKTRVSGIIVAVIGFSLNFGVYVCEIFRSGIGAVSTGQWEAASALGFGRFKTFSKVILPQALVHILPVYKGEFISMLKSTAVVGYIAVQDLTKVSDIIRSRTYDALFPLLTTALIYFLLSWLLSTLLSLIEFRFDPKKRKNLLSDINLDDLSDFEHNSVKGEKGETLITLEHIRKEYELATPLEDVSAEICRGDIIAVIGPSGTGKSTLLRCINRMEAPSSGKVYAFGAEVPDKGEALYRFRMRVGMVFQSFNLFTHLTVIENLMLAPVELLSCSRQEAYQRGMQLLALVGLTDKALSYPDELSGGQMQRVAIVRTLAMQPEVILLDEPTSALDPTMIGEVLSVIRTLADKGYTMMIVTHEMKFARDISNRVFYLDQGGIYEDGTADQIFNHPAKERTRAFIHRLKIFRRTIRSKSFDYFELANAVRNFGHEELMPPQTLEALAHSVEELCTNGLIKAPVRYPAELDIEYAQEGDTVLTLRYGGEILDITESMDGLAATIFRRFSREQRHEYKDGQNTLTIVI